jgi:hypothetical protein
VTAAGRSRPRVGPLGSRSVTSRHGPVARSSAPAGRRGDLRPSEGFSHRLPKHFGTAPNDWPGGREPGTDAREAATVVVGEPPDLPHLPEPPWRGLGTDFVGRAAAPLVDIAVEVVPSALARHGAHRPAGATRPSASPASFRNAAVSAADAGGARGADRAAARIAPLAAGRAVAVGVAAGVDHRTRARIVQRPGRPCRRRPRRRRRGSSARWSRSRARWPRRPPRAAAVPVGTVVHHEDRGLPGESFGLAATAHLLRHPNPRKQCEKLDGSVPKSSSECPTRYVASRPPSFWDCSQYHDRRRQRT